LIQVKCIVIVQLPKGCWIAVESLPNVFGFAA
jgi:hypothetical protein